MLKKSIAAMLSIIMVLSMFVLAPVTAKAAAAKIVYKDFATTPGQLMKLGYSPCAGKYDIYVGAPGHEKRFTFTDTTPNKNATRCATTFYVPAGQTITRVIFYCYDTTYADINLIAPAIALCGVLTSNHHFLSGAATQVTDTSALISRCDIGIMAKQVSDLKIQYSSSPTAFEYGNNDEAVTVSVSGTQNNFGARLTGLKPGTTYYYQVVDRYNLFSDVRSFRTTSPSDPVNLIKNGSFEENAPSTPGTYNASGMPAANVPGWIAEKNKLELQVSAYLPTYFPEEGVIAYAPDGHVKAELNTDTSKPAEIYQDFPTTPGSVLQVKFALGARMSSPSLLGLKMGAPGKESQVATFQTNTYAHEYMTYNYTVPAGQTTTRLRFVSLSYLNSQRGCDLDDVSVVVIKGVNQPVVKTGDVSAVQSDLAYIVGNTYTGFDSPITGTWNQVSTSMSMAPATMHNGITRNTPFDALVTGLTPNTTYFYRAAVQSNGSMYYGEIKSFKTPIDIYVFTGYASNITSTSARTNDSFFSGVQPNQVQTAYIYYSTSPNMQNPVRLSAPSVTNPYSLNLNGLTPSTTYYYQAVISVNGQLYYGQVVNFKTTARL